MSQVKLVTIDGPDNSWFEIFGGVNPQHIGIKRVLKTGSDAPDPIFCENMPTDDSEVFAELIKTMPGYFFGELAVDDRTTESLFTLLKEHLADFEGTDGFRSCEHENRDGVTTHLNVHTSYGMTSVHYSNEAEPNSGDNDFPVTARRFGNGWIVTPSKKVSGAAAIFTYDRLETDDVDCEYLGLTGNENLITRLTDEWLVAHDPKHNYFRVWCDGRFELLSVLEAIRL